MLLARACRISQEGVYNIYAMAECKMLKFIYNDKKIDIICRYSELLEQFLLEVVQYT